MEEQTLPDHAKETIRVIDKKLADLESARKELLAGRRALLNLFQEVGDPGAQQPRPRIDMTECPLSVEEMISLGDRHRIIREIAMRHPDGRVHVPQAAKWLHGSGVVPTIPTNMAKALGRKMRNDPNWIAEAGGWFRLVDHHGTGPSED